MRKVYKLLSSVLMATALACGSSTVFFAEDAAAEEAAGGSVSFDNVVLADTDVVTIALTGFYEEEVNWQEGAQVEKSFSVKVTNKSDHGIMLNPGHFYINDEKCYVSMQNGSVDLEAGKSGNYSFMVAFDTKPQHTALASLDQLYLLEGTFDGLNKYEDDSQNSDLEVAFSIPEAIPDKSDISVDVPKSDQNPYGNIVAFDEPVLADNDTLTLSLLNFYEKEYNWSEGAQVEKCFTVRATNKSDHVIMLNPGQMYLGDEQCYVSMNGGSINLDPDKCGNYDFLIAYDTQPNHTALKSLDELYQLEGSFSGLNEYEDASQNSSLEVDFSIPESVKMGDAGAADAADDPAAAETESAEDALDAALGQANEAMDITGEAADTAAQAEQTEAPAKEYETLQEGSNGDGVVALQQALIDQGFLTGAADGAYGAGTAASVKAFQESMGLQATGIADSQTQNLLFNGMDVSGIEVKVTGTARTDYMNIDGMFTDESYVDEESSSLTVLYLFYTVTTNDQNLQIFGGSTDLTINGANTYDRTRLMNTGIYFGNYYYTNYGHDVYMGDEVRILETFRIPKADLAPGRTITLSNDDIPETDQIRLVTDDIIPLNGPRMISKVIDPEGYEIASEKLTPADDELTARVKNEIMGTWNVTAGILALQIEFGDGTYTLYTPVSTASGTYEITNGYVILTESTSGGKSYAPYSFGDNGSFDFGIAHAFDPDAM